MGLSTPKNRACAKKSLPDKQAERSSWYTGAQPLYQDFAEISH
jgi:hypothetical protein